MDKSKAAINAIKLINQAKRDIDLRPLMIKAVCSYFDLMKDNELSQSDKLFMHYLANQVGIPQYYYPMLNVGTDVDKEVSLQTFCNYVQESSMVVGDGVMLHRYQKEVLNMFTKVTMFAIGTPTFRKKRRQDVAQSQWGLSAPSRRLPPSVFHSIL